MTEVKERSVQKFKVRFLDSSRALAAPSEARWRLKNLETGEIVKDWTTIATPSSEETITINSDLNTIRSGRRAERYELVVQSEHTDTSLKQTRSIQYKVVNLSAVED